MTEPIVALNPYDSPRETSELPKQASRPEPADFRFWRIYVLIHLATVIDAAVCHFAAPRLVPTDNGLATAVCLVFFVFALAGGLFVWAFPFVGIGHLTSAIRYDWRYVLTILAEFVLCIGWLIIMLPAVQ